MTKRNTQFPPDATTPDATVPDEAAPINGEDALPSEGTDEGPSASEAVIETSPIPQAPVDPPTPTEPPPPELPVASVLPPLAPLLDAPAVTAPLEARIGRLEAELARLHAGQTGDARVAAFPVAQAARNEAAPAPDPVVVRPPRRFWADFGKRLVAPSAPAASPTRTDGLSSMIPPAVRRGWVLLDALTELRAIYWMFCDPRYRLSWTARLAPPVLLVLIVTSLFWMPAAALPVVGMVIDKVVDLVLAYLLFKLLSHEARRYRETAPDLPPSLRL